MKKIHDISVPLSSGLPLWPGDPLPVFERFSKMEDGELANVSRMAMCVHFGTHIDAPYHFVKEGARMDDLLLETMIGPAYVVRIPDDCSLITREVLHSISLPKDIKRVLFRTCNSRHWMTGSCAFDERFTALSADGAKYLVELGVRLVGIDYLSIAPYSEPAETHQVLLENGMVILETLDLSAVEAGPYELYCLPLKLAGAEGAPARAILISDEEM